MEAFTPKEITFAEGVERLQAALTRAGVNLDSGILTSRDPRLHALRDELRLPGLPDGFTMWQIPVPLNRSLLFLQVALPHAQMPEHRHPHAPVFRLVVSGSIIHAGIELTVGDWMYVPKGIAYSFTAGALGAAVMYPHPEPW